MVRKIERRKRRLERDGEKSRLMEGGGEPAGQREGCKEQKMKR